MPTLTKTIPKGYKQTEIGVIPADWDVKTLGDLGNVKMCRRIFNHETRETGSIPFYKIGTFGKEADAYISQNLYEEYRRKFSFPKEGDILISAAGTIGRTIVYDGTPSYFQDSNIVWIDNDESLVSNQYLNYIFEVAKYNTEGGTIQRLYNSILSNTKFICPTEPEQESIATALSDIDALIQKTESLIEKKKAIKQGAMQELLTGKRRLPGFSGEWEEIELRKMGQILMGQSPLGASYTSDYTQTPLLNGAADLRETGIRISQFTSNPTKLSKVGDLLFCIRATIGNLQISDRVYCLGRGVAGMTVSNQCDVKFVSYILNNLFELMKRQSEGGVIKGLKKEDLGNYKSLIPKQKQEQTAIATILSDMDTEIEKLESELTKWRDVKQGMMQTLLTGKIRLIK